MRQTRCKPALKRVSRLIAPEAASVEAADIHIRHCDLRYFCFGRNLDFDAAERRASDGAAGAHAQPREWPDHVRYRRLLVLPCRSQ